MASKSTQLGHGLAKVLGIKLDYRHEVPVTRGESTFSVESADSYVEEEPTVAEWIASVTPSVADGVNYVKSLFPFTAWILSYNLQWLYGDLVAGMFILGFELSLIRNTHIVARTHHRSCCCAAEHGVRVACRSWTGIWIVLILYGCIDILVLCNV